MKKHYDDLLLSLPPDTTMRKFVADRRVPLPAGLNWRDHEATRSALLESIRSWTDMSARDALIAELSRVETLSHAEGREAVYEIAASTNGGMTVQLAIKDSDLHRAFWLYVHHRDLFERAMDILYFDGYESRAQLHDLGVRATPNLSSPALDSFRRDVGDYYHAGLGIGEHSIAYALTRPTGNVLFTLHLKDLPTLRLEFDGADLRQHVGNPDFILAMEYCPRTGMTQTLVKGGAKYHEMLLKAFAKHILHVVHVDPQRLLPPSLDLTSLRTGFYAPEAVDDGFERLRVKSLTLLDTAGELKIQASAMGFHNDQCVTQLLAKNASTAALLDDGWSVSAAQIDLYYPPEPGKARKKVVKIEITNRGRLNLHQYDETLKGQLEGYLVTAGILGIGQTLVANKVDADENEPGLTEV